MRDEVKKAQKEIFGKEDRYFGEQHFYKRLEGEKYKSMFYASRLNLQTFDVGDYMEMQ